MEINSSHIRLIDTHAHLNYPEILKNLDEILLRAQEKGVEKIIVPATDYKSSLEITELVQKHSMLYGAVGIHPTEVLKIKENDFYAISELAKENKIVAIGEIGLDYYWKPFDRDLQIKILETQLEIAESSDLPVILHNRESSEDLINIIKEKHRNGRLKGQFHSFSGDLSMAIDCVKMGFYISFTGNITYKPKSSTLLAFDILRHIPLENLLLETDTPYLPPIPYRGKRNEPSFLIHTVIKISEIKNISIKELTDRTTLNALKLFKMN
ncbi:MAG: TatD family hydrolase [Ignavibacteria bacterium]|nr:TatD family hydrolase [Ignavibacteria bacterium]